MKILIETKRYGIKEVLIDAADYPLIKDYVWHVTWDKNNFYARCNIRVKGKRKSPKMHRMIMGIWKKERPHVDHKNHNGLDNRRANLRLATIGQNTKNLTITKRNTTGYKGVYLYKKGANAGLYTATIRSNRVTYFGGYFNTAIEAAFKYNELAVMHHGEFACINKIDKKELAKAKLFIAPKKEPNPPKSNTGFYGVVEYKNGCRKNPFKATCKGVFIGYFDTAEKAAKAYDRKAIELYGETAVLNFK